MALEWPLMWSGYLQKGRIFVPSYKAFVVDASGRRLRSHDFAAENQSEAATHALAYLDGHTVELWDDTGQFLVLKPQKAELGDGTRVESLRAIGDPKGPSG